MQVPYRFESSEPNYIGDLSSPMEHIPLSTDRAQPFGALDPRVRLRTIAIKKLRLDFQPRTAPGEDIVSFWVARFLEGQPVEPVRVYFDGEAYYLAQGFDRLAAARRAGRRMILADVRWGTRADAARNTDFSL